MKKTALGVVVIVILSIGFILHSPVNATSQQAYQDYLYQFDIYRQNYSDFQVAQNEYQKFQSLTAQTDALNKTKTMLSQRDQLLRSYLLLLDERLREDQGLAPATKQTYEALLQNEATFLASHAQLISAIGSIDDATQVSRQLESHYMILQVSIRQILIGLALGQLSILNNFYKTDLQTAQSLINTYSSNFTSDKQQTINRWILEIQNKQVLFQQKYDALVAANAQFTADDQNSLDQKFGDLSSQINDARQYLLEGSSYLIELKNALKFTN